MLQKYKCGVKMNKLRIGVFALLFCVLANTAFAQIKETLYISPNNDGIQDELIIPIKISEKRYVAEWALVITDESEQVVRSIGNKEKRQEMPTGFWNTIKWFGKQLVTPKQGVEVPETVMWNGILDSGETAPDGIYYYYVTATDDNGNQSKTVPLKVVVDNTEPEINLVPPKESAKIFGAGNKPTLKIEQSGSIEEIWTAKVLDNLSNAVRVWEWKKASPETIEWDGKDNLGNAVSEGVYTYKIASTDLAGNNSEPAQITNIIYDAIPRSVNMSVKDSPFSPNGDKIKDTLTIVPTMSSSTGLLNWEIVVLDNGNKIVKTFNGTTTPPTQIEYDGKNTVDTVLPDGDYQLRFTSSFNNGQTSEISRNFTVDNTSPFATVKADGSIFSPDGDSRLDTLAIFQEGSREKEWTGTIYTEQGKVVKSYSFGEIPPTSIVWDGVTSDGKVSDGLYYYELSATDLAGNKGFAKSDLFELNTGTTEILLTVTPSAFSPNGDKVQETVVFTPVIKSNTGIASYELEILDATGKVIKTFAEKRSIPSSIPWNGLADDSSRSPDGVYTARLHSISKNGGETTIVTQPFTMDTVYPEVSVTIPYDIFSPNADGQKDILPINITTSNEAVWQGSITDASKNTVRSFRWEGSVPSFNWDGNDEAGNVVADGKYSFNLSSTDSAGNKAQVSISGITVDNRAVKAYVTAELDAFSPNGDGKVDTQNFTIMTTVPDGIDTWSFSIFNAENKLLLRQWNQNDSKAVPSSIIWDGIDTTGKVFQGQCYAQLEVSYTKGDVVSISTTPFISWATAPQLTVKTAPKYFSPDNDGIDDDLYISLKGSSIVPFTQWSFEIKDPQNGKSFWKTSGKSAITERIIWDGRGNNGELVQSATDYPYTFTVTDSLGMTSAVSGIISVDVLVIRVGNVLKMQVPSIIFRSDNADFMSKAQVKNGLEQSVIDNNIRVLKRIAEILNKFKEYNVTIEGHANNITGTEEEETSTANGNIPLVPLSEARANYVKEQLVANNVDGSRLSTIGMGGRYPVVSREDRDNWWKNRRVEFILNK